MKNQIRSAGIACRYLHVLPANAAPPSCLQSLQHRFFCREARCIMLRGDRAALVAICTFGDREHALAKTRAPHQHFANPRNFDNVYANGDDHKRN